MTEPTDVSTEALSRKVDDLSREVAELSNNVRDLVEAWRTARGVVRFVKVLGGVAGSVATIWAVVKLVTGSKL